MRQFLITVAGVLAGLILFVVIAPMVLIASFAGHASHREAMPDNVVLRLDLRSSITDQRPPNCFGLCGGNLSTVEIVRKLDAAAHDARVKGVYVRAATEGIDPAQAEEIGAALNGLRAANKFVIAHIQNDGAEMSLPAYAAIAGASEIWLQESGDFMPMGLLSQRMYLGGALEKFHVKAQFEARKQYKDAVTEYTAQGPTPASREATLSLLSSIYDSEVAAVAADRKMPAAQAKTAIEGTPYTAAEAIKQKLADRLGRPEDAAAAALAEAGKGAQLFDLAKYNPTHAGGPTIALVTAEGDISSGPPDGPSLTGSQQISSDQISQALIDAANDSDVKAIVFRVSSPGGSAVASDQISHAVALAQEKGKKVVVSMGPYAASGGYYISAGADEIVADPTTITGSIGIFGGKIVIGEALNHYLGVTFWTIPVGSPDVAMFDATKPFTPEQQKAFSAIIDRGYAEFKGVVAAGRHMSLDKVEDIAKGRVWSGAQAKQRGLVDDLGGLDVAIARAKALAGIKGDENVVLKLYPRQRSPFEALERLLGVSAESARTAVALSAVMGDERLDRLLDAALSRRQGLRAEADPIAVR